MAATWWWKTSRPSKDRLAIVKHVLNRHQARLEVASEPGRGSTFSAVFGGEWLLAPSVARA